MLGREKLIELVHNARMNALWHNAQKPSEYITDMLISNSVTVRERGRWEYHGGDDDMNLYGFCSKCHANWDEDIMEKFNFCPNCGADMRGEEDA